MPQLNAKKCLEGNIPVLLALIPCLSSVFPSEQHPVLGFSLIVVVTESRESSLVEESIRVSEIAVVQF